MNSVPDFMQGLRWPLHPKPHKREVLNAWVSRIADAYGIRYDIFIHRALGCTGPYARNMDYLTEAQLSLLSNGTGISIKQLETMNSESIVLKLISNVIADLSK